MLRISSALRVLQVLTGVQVLALAPARADVALVAGGDVMLDRGVARQIDRRGAAWLFGGISSHLRAADQAFANLECPLTEAPRKVARPVVFHAPTARAYDLRRAGFGVVSVANNHALDCGSGGLRETLAALRRANVQAVGAAGEAPVVRTVRGLRIAYLAFSQWSGVSSRSPSINILSDESLRSGIVKAREVGDVIVVSCHWGNEYQTRPSSQQKRWARLAAQWGADVILGHHPHVWQGLQVLAGPPGSKRRALVAYSLGNLVFDSPRGRDSRARQTGLLRIVLGKSGVQSARVVPLTIEHCRPRAATRAEAAHILGELRKLSRGLNTRLEPDGRVLLSGR
jgi:poly-gamma-glutamate synthesis protein (capsule biosynthesis protein)